ncbi:MAG TPA: alpha-L-fucosidase [Verrucomicrobiae bacterium]|nr:alpha-L-fucosidase [Verrucomicrobiae bacterium]
MPMNLKKHLRFNIQRPIFKDAQWLSLGVERSVFNVECFRKAFLLLVLALSLSLHAADLPLPAPPEDTPIIATNDSIAAQRLAWWSEARFGMFIHWGLYSQDGCFYKGTNGGSEHMMQRLKIPLADYAKIADDFNPTNFNADEWAGIAKAAGMKYMVLTSKHHDGFAMYNSQSSDFNIVKRTPWHRDPVKELAEACRKQGLKFGVYYSLGRDWEDPDVPTRDGYRSNTWDYPDENKKVFAKYFERKVKPQITELLTHYGPISELWFDTPEKISAAESQELVDLIHKLQPDCIINSRVGHGLGDYGVSEQKIPGAGDVKPWETCMTLNGHWGYFKGDEKWKPAATVIRNLVDIVSKGGNYLLNVGPTGAGVIPAGAVNDLQQVGAWMKVNGESIYGTTGSPLKTQPAWGRVTQKGNTLYLHVFDWPKDGKLVVAGLRNNTVAATLLAGDKRLKTVGLGDGLTISLPVAAPDAISSTIVLKLKGPVEVK